MKIKFKIIVILFLGAFLMSSCEDFFEIDDREKLTEELVLSKDADVSAMWAYLYHNLEMGFTQVGNAMLANACDEADLNAPFAAIQKFNDGSWNSFDNPEDSWNSLFAGIRNANKFLESTDPAVNKRFTYDEYRIVDPVRYARLTRELKAYHIDAKFIKAYCYFELWKRYGAVPIVDQLISLEESYELNRNSSTEVVNYILGLLDEIIPEFAVLETMEGTEYNNGKWSSNHFGRITKGAALALKSRTLLYAASPLNSSNEQYDQALCIEAAKTAAEIINMGLYSTNLDYRSIFLDKTASNPENILDNRVMVNNFNYMERWNYPLGGSDQWVTTGIGTNATCPSQGLVDAYETIDGSPVDPQDPYTNRDPRFKQTILSNGDMFNDAPVESFVGGKAGIGDKNATTTGYYLKKFIREKLNLNIDATGPHVWYVFRYSEVLLNYAEAMYYAHGASTKMGYVNGGDLSAIDAINLIRGRTGVGMPARTSLTEDQLRNERRIELAFEGHRFWDVRRWKIAEQTENMPLKGMRITKEGESLTYEVVEIEKRKFVSPAMYRYPIPFVEMTNYSDWTQNTGWDN
tara:strand:+ start:15191 stop:16918 length:1728 start_codon:yes stop_codon:yes gene_type:complete